MAGSRYPHTTRTPKNRATTYLLYYGYFCSVEKNHHSYRRWINSFPQFLASHTLKMNLVINKFNSKHSGKLKIVKLLSYRSLPRPFRILESGRRAVLSLSGRLVTTSQRPSWFSGIALKRLKQRNRYNSEWSSVKTSDHNLNLLLYSRSTYLSSRLSCCVFSQFSIVAKNKSVTSISRPSRIFKNQQFRPKNIFPIRSNVQLAPLIR